MILPCFYRAGATGAIVEGRFDLNAGTLETVPVELFYLKAPASFKSLFSTSLADPVFKSSTKEACIDIMYKIPHVMCALAGDGAFVYGLSYNGIIMQSTHDEDQQKVIPYEQYPVMFPEPYRQAGFFRQKTLSFNFPLLENQFINVFTLKNGKNVFFTDKGIKEVNFQFDNPPNYGQIKYMQFINEKDRDVVGVVTVNGTAQYVRIGG